MIITLELELKSTHYFGQINLKQALECSLRKNLTTLFAHLLVVGAQLTSTKVLELKVRVFIFGLTLLKH